MYLEATPYIEDIHHYTAEQRAVENDDVTRVFSTWAPGQGYP